MMNIDNNGIENTETTIQTIDSVVEQQQGDAEYEAAFAAELAAEGESAEDLGDQPASGVSDEASFEGDDLVDADPDVEAITALEAHHMAGPADGEQDEADQVTVPAQPEAEGKAAKPKTPPAYLSFVAAVEAHAIALGLSVKEQKSYFQFWNTNGHKIYVEKALKKGVSRIDTSLPRSALVINGKDISLPLSKPNGRIACHVDPSVESVKQALEVLASYSDKIPAPKKPATKDQPAAA